MSLTTPPGGRTDRSIRFLWGRCLDEHEHTTDRLITGVGGRTPGPARQGEGSNPSPRLARGGAPADAVAARGGAIRVCRAGRQGEPARPLRRAPPAGRLPRV